MQTRRAKFANNFAGKRALCEWNWKIDERRTTFIYWQFCLLHNSVFFFLPNIGTNKEKDVFFINSFCQDI